MEAAVGAATWPVGAQVWNGHRPAKIAKPTNTSGNAHIWKFGGKGYFANSNKLIVFAPEITNAAIIPIKTIALPTNEYSANFIAPYSRRVDPQIAIRKYFGIIAS